MACLVPVVTTKVRFPGVAVADEVNWTVKLNWSRTVTLPTVMPGPAWTVVVA